MDWPHQQINGSGNLHCFSEWDGKQQKTFTSGAPEPLAKTQTPTVICNWCMKFHAHAQARRIHVCDCFDFCPLTGGNPKGNTCGDDTLAQQCNIPLPLELKLWLWLLLTHTALQNVFSTSCANECCIIQRHHGLGRKAFFDPIGIHHLAHNLHPPALHQKFSLTAPRTSSMNTFTAFN